MEADEIAGPPALFERLDVVPEIGQKFQIPLRIQGGKVENYDFTITGILEQTDISKLNVNETRLVYGAFVSEKFVEQHIAPEDRTYTAYIRIVNENKHSKDEIETIISEIAEDVGLNKSDISFNEQYLTYMTNPGTQERNVMIGLGLLVVFLGGMVIYSIYYVSVISNIQEIRAVHSSGMKDGAHKYIVTGVQKNSGPKAVRFQAEGVDRESKAHDHNEKTEKQAMNKNSG